MTPNATTVALNTQPERGHAVATTKVRTTFTPGTVTKVESAELLDLSRLGLLFSHEDSKDAQSLELKPKHKWVDEDGISEEEPDESADKSEEQPAKADAKKVK